jgi:hypothetical protein
MIDRRHPMLMEVMNFCSLQNKIPHPFVDCQKGITRINIDGLQSLLNVMGVGALLREKFDGRSRFDFVQIDIINMRNADKRQMPAECSPLSSITWNQLCSEIGSELEELIISLNFLRRPHACRVWLLFERPTIPIEPALRLASTVTNQRNSPTTVKWMLRFICCG